MRIKGVEFTVGADPEVFVIKDGNPISPHEVTDGTKKKPAPLYFKTMVQIDGMALEFNIPPLYNRESFENNIAYSKKRLGRLVKEMVNGLISITPTAEFSEEEWAKAPEENKILGCQPDYNGWSERINEAPNPNVTFRTGAGHIHTGWGAGFPETPEFISICSALAREQDATNGVASVLYDPDVKRRELYGKAGSFRPKPYGMEYRTLSNYWVKYSKLTGYVYSRTMDAMRNAMNRRMVHTPEVQDIINSNKIEEAKYFLTHHSIPLPPKQYRLA